MDWSKPIEINQVEYVFPADVIGRYLPELSEIPEDLDKEFEELAQYAFSHAVELKPEALKEGIDPELANRHFNAVLRSFQPKHQHKLKGAGYLLYLWLK
jgi:hypothetical protein